MEASDKILSINIRSSTPWIEVFPLAIYQDGDSPTAFGWLSAQSYRWIMLAGRFGEEVLGAVQYAVLT